MVLLDDSDNEGDFTIKRQKKQFFLSSDDEDVDQSKDDLSYKNNIQERCDKSEIRSLSEPGSEILNTSASQSPVDTGIIFKSGLIINSCEDDNNSEDNENDSLTLSKPCTDSTSNVNLPSKKDFISNSKVLTLSDLDTDGDDDHIEPRDDKCLVTPEGSETLQKQKKSKDKTKIKKVKKVDQKLLIKSETQRMERERQVSLPYHRPKQRTLQEFLSRRKNQIPVHCLRSTATSMAVKWKEIDEGIKGVPEFFKSESEGEEENSEILKSDDDANDDSSNGSVTDDFDGPKEQYLMKSNPENGSSIIKNINCVKSPTIENCEELNNIDLLNEENIHNLKSSIIEGFGLKNQDLIKCTPNDSSCNENINYVKSPIEIENLSDLAGVAHLTSYSNEMEKGYEDVVPSDIDLVSSKALSTLEKEKPMEIVSNWLEDIILLEKRDTHRKEMEKLLSPEVWCKVPVLSKEADEFINLDKSNSPPFLSSGGKELMDRLLKAYKPSSASTVTEIVTASPQIDDSGVICDLIVDKISIVSTSKLEKTCPSGPGARLQELRDNLKTNIEAKWQESFKKRCAESSNFLKNNYDEIEDGLSENESEKYDVHSNTKPGAEDSNSEGNKSEPEENDIDISDKHRPTCAFGDSEAEESEGEADSEHESESEKSFVDEHHNVVDSDEKKNNCESLSDCNDDSDLEGSLPAFQPGGGLLNGGSVLTQLTQPLPITGLSPILSPMGVNTGTSNYFSAPVSVDQTPTRSSLHKDNVDILPCVKKSLFDNAPPKSTSFFENGEDGDDPYQFVSGVFPEEESLIPCKTIHSKKRIILPADSDNESEGPEEENRDVGSLISSESSQSGQNISSTPAFVKIYDKEEENVSEKKKKKRLTFSDDENKSSESESDNEDEPTDEKSELDENEMNVDYDSEENEVIPMNPKDFLEHEAELSESEWSGDEDEQGLDALDIEAGDADDIDEDQMQSQLGKIHMRRILDQDARDVRLLQELLFEDGDLHTDGKGRDRKFRWKNLSGFEGTGVRQIEGSESEDENEQTEIELAKLRHEKAQFLLQLQKDGKETLSGDELIEEDPLLSAGRRALDRNRPKADVQISDGKLAPLRGSFLSKNSNFLSRLARLTTSNKEGPLGPKNSRNFVFAAVSPPKEKISNDELSSISVKVVKRKSLGFEDDGVAKRTKLSIITAGPSFLDQLH